MKLVKELSLGEIASIAGGKVEGPSGLMVHSIAISPFAAGAGELAVVFEAKSLKRLGECRASAVMVPPGVMTSLPKIVVDRPLLAMKRMLEVAQPKRHLPDPGIHPSAFVAPSCQIEEGVAIGPLASIGPGCKIGKGTRIGQGCLIGGQVTIGENCLLHQGCLIADYVQIGNRVILQQGASIGADGFSYVTERLSNLERRIAGITELVDEPNPPLKIPNVGTVIIEDDVEIGSNATIDRATMGATIIGQGSKIDNLVMVAHNARIGREVMVAAMTAIAGSCQVGDRSVLAGHVGVKDHLKIGKDVIIEGKAGVMRDVSDGEIQVGSPAVPVREYFTQVAISRKAPKMFDDIKALSKRIANLEKLIEIQGAETR